MFASTLAWVSTTPLGSPVLPDVYWISAGVVASARGVTGRAPSPSASAATTAPMVRTRRRTACAARSASANVTSRRASAFARMPACRRRYSSMRAVRNGG